MEGTCPNCGYCPECGRGGHGSPRKPWGPIWRGDTNTDLSVDTSGDTLDFDTETFTQDMDATTDTFKATE